MDEVVIKRVIDAPSTEVWKALTDKNELKQWLPFFAGFEPVIGHELRFTLGKDAEHQYEHISKLIEYVEGKKIVHGWRYEGYPGDSHVTFELFPDGGKANLVVTHKILEPFPADNPDFGLDGFEEGWNQITAGLNDYLMKQAR